MAEEGALFARVGLGVGVGGESVGWGEFGCGGSDGGVGDAEGVGPCQGLLALQEVLVWRHLVFIEPKLVGCWWMKSSFGILKRTTWRMVLSGKTGKGVGYGASWYD